MKFPSFPKRKEVYVFRVTTERIFPPFTWLGKVGHGEQAIDRAKEVESSIRNKLGMPYKIEKFLSVRLFMYRAAEKAIHTVIRPLNSKIFAGANGGTEIFIVLNVFCGLCAYIALWGFGVHCAGMLALIIMLIPYPIDFAFFILLLAVAEYTLIGLAAWGAWTVGISLISFLN